MLFTVAGFERQMHVYIQRIHLNEITFLNDAVYCYLIWQPLPLQTTVKQKTKQCRGEPIVSGSKNSLEECCRLKPLVVFFYIFNSSLYFGVSRRRSKY